MTVREKLIELESENKSPSHILTDIGLLEIDRNDPEIMNDDTSNCVLCDIEILLSDARGIYIPRDFLDCYSWEGITEENKKDLSSPENEFYWDVWETVLNNAFFMDASGKKWELWQNGDLFAIHYYR
jgi:hypothetical protein